MANSDEPITYSRHELKDLAGEFLFGVDPDGIIDKMQAYGILMAFCDYVYQVACRQGRLG